MVGSIEKDGKGMIRLHRDERKDYFIMYKKGKDIQETIYQFCVDCKRPTEQTYHHTNLVDGDLVYICKECGCENSYDEE